MHTPLSVPIANLLLLLCVRSTQPNLSIHPHRPGGRNRGAGVNAWRVRRTRCTHGPASRSFGLACLYVGTQTYDLHWQVATVVVTAEQLSTSRSLWVSRRRLGGRRCATIWLSAGRDRAVLHACRRARKTARFCARAGSIDRSTYARTTPRAAESTVDAGIVQESARSRPCRPPLSRIVKVVRALLA